MPISTPMPTSTRITLALLATTMLLSSCAVGPDYERPSTPVPVNNGYKETFEKNFIGPMQPKADAVQETIDKNLIGPVQPKPEVRQELAKASPADGIPRGKWWELFNDEALSKLEEQVNLNNQNVRLAEANWHQARALVSEARATFFPTIGATGSMERSGTGKGAGNASGTTFGGRVQNSYEAEGQASWVPDIWGKVRRQVEGAKATAEEQAANLAAAQLTQQADLAVDYLDLRLADEQKRLLTNSVIAFRKSVTITENQYKTGVAASSDVLQAKVLLETTQAQLVDVGVQRAQFEHAIAMLIGKAPEDFSIPETTTIPPLPEIPAGMPSQLLERRPDIAAAERAVTAANAQIGVAESAFFPTLTLSATGGYSSSELYQWFTLPTRFWSIGPSLVEPIFDAGLRSAQTEAAIDAYDGTVATYRQTVLSAFQAVEDNLAQIRIYSQELNVLSGAVKDAKAEVTVSMNQYLAGTISYLNVVTAQTAELNNELSELTVRKERLTASAMLIENLGGGWDAQELQNPKVTQGKTHPWSLLPPKVDRP